MLRRRVVMPGLYFNALLRPRGGGPRHRTWTAVTLTFLLFLFTFSRRKLFLSRRRRPLQISSMSIMVLIGQTFSQIERNEYLLLPAI